MDQPGRQQRWLSHKAQPTAGTPTGGLLASAGLVDARFNSRNSAAFALLMVNAGIDIEHATGRALPLSGVGVGHSEGVRDAARYASGRELISLLEFK